MKHYRIRLEVDIKARSRDQAEQRALCIYSDLEHRSWIVEVLPNGMEERIPLSPRLERGKP